MLAEGRWHLHQFRISEDLGVVARGATLYPLRFIANNPKVAASHLVGVLNYVAGLGDEYERSLR